MAARLDALWAVLVGGAAFAVYLRTLAPGLVADLDTPMFQFVGRVLGVAHNPGYPLYVLLTFPFSYLPVGSLPYRINLFSALLGALTVSLAFLLARRLGCRRVVAAAATLGMAFGHVFWSQAVVAEVYTLASAIVAGVLLALVSWGQTGRARFFYTAVALFAAGLGNHTTIVGFAPGMALYALLTNRGFVLRFRTLALTTLILLAGLLQYGFVIIRSRQPGAYVESPAATLGALLGVMTGRQFGDRVFAFEWRVVAFERLPWLVEQILAPELTVPGLVLALVGVTWLLRRRTAEGLLLSLGAAAVAAFALNYSGVDTPVFLIPTTFVLWVGVAVGTEQTARLVEGRRRIAFAVAAIALALPAWQLTRNYAATDRSRDTAAAVTFDALFDVLPDRSVFVHEDFLVDRMVRFKLLGDRSAGERHIELAPVAADAVRKRLDAGFTVFAFEKSARRLRQEALNVDFAPLALTQGSLESFLSRLPGGAIVALAVPAAHAERFAAAHGTSFAAVGGPSAVAGITRASLAVVGIRGARGGALFRTSVADLRVSMAAGDPIGATGVTLPAAVEVRLDGVEAAIRQGSRDAVRTLEGAVLAVWSADGRLEHTMVLQAAHDFRVPVPSGPLSVYRVRGVWAGLDLSADDWTDVVGAARTGSTMVRLPPHSSAVIYLGGAAPLAPRIIDQSSARVRVEITSFDGATREVLNAALEADGLRSSWLQLAPYVYRMEAAAGSEAVSVLTALGGVPAHAAGRIVAGRLAEPGKVFRIDTLGLLRTPDRASEVLLMARDDQSQLTGAGWSDVDWDGVSPYRWMTSTEARLLLPVAGPDARRIRVQALLEEGGAPRSIGLRVNGVELPAQALRTGWDAYEWALPGGMVERLANEVVVTVDRLSPPTSGSPARGIAVTELRVIHER